MFLLVFRFPPLQWHRSVALCRCIQPRGFGQSTASRVSIWKLLGEFWLMFSRRFVSLENYGILPDTCGIVWGWGSWIWIFGAFVKCGNDRCNIDAYVRGQVCLLRFLNFSFNRLYFHSQTGWNSSMHSVASRKYWKVDCKRLQMPLRLFCQGLVWFKLKPFLLWTTYLDTLFVSRERSCDIYFLPWILFIFFLQKLFISFLFSKKVFISKKIT